MTRLTSAIFFGHGNPMNAIGQNAYTDGWSQLGQSMPRPRAILSISAHWYVPETGVTITTAPRTIHDFGGFPPALYRIEYPAPGDPALARRVQQLLAPLDVKLDHSWGLDHGTWSVLKHAFPKAEVPVVQLSIDATQPAAFHYELGARLAPLREEGVLIAGSGNVVHNLRVMGRDGGSPYDWAVRFNDYVRDALATQQYQRLVAYEEAGEDARLSVPTPEHYLPLLYVLGAQRPGETAAVAVDGLEIRSISMLSVTVGVLANR